jgi:hypothetical protein
VLPEDFPHQAFGTVAHDGTAEFLGCGNPEPCPAVRSRQGEHRHQSAMLPRARLVHLLELGPPADMAAGAKAVIHGIGGASRAAPRLSGRRHAEALPALCAAPFQHDAAVLRAHADQEAVGAATPAVIRLKSALHGVFRILWARQTRWSVQSTVMN